MTRAEHVAWAKQRALEYVDMGIPGQAISSLVCDLAKNEETERDVLMLGLSAPLFKPSGNTMEAWSKEVRKWIDEVE